MTKLVVAVVAALTLSLGMSAARAHSARGPAQEPQAPTSYELIDRALAAAQIDTETAYKYRVFAGFADTRLPAAYHGDDRGMVTLPPSVAEAGRLLDTFSPATRTELAPFFMRPADPGSWISLSTIPGQEPGEDRGPGDDEHDEAVSGAAGAPFRSGPAPDPTEATLPSADLARGAVHDAAGQPPQVVWKTVAAVGGKAKVWAQDRYPGDYAIAQGLASALDALIWDKLTGLMHQEPYPDNGIVNNGGDAAFDIYLVHAPGSGGWIGLTTSSIPGAPCQPAVYLQIDTRLHGLGSATKYGALQIATHELMHAIVAAYRVKSGCPDIMINEASAEWASSWVYPLTDDEHTSASSYLTSVFYPLGWGLYQDRRYYGEYLLPYYMEKTSGSPDFMPEMWTNFKTMDVLAGINAVLDGGFKKSWPLFLLQLWNRPPVDAPTGFKGWDRLAQGASRLPHGDPTLDADTILRSPSGITTKEIEFMQAAPFALIFEPGVQPLSGIFEHFMVDKSVRSLVFRNTIHEEGLLDGTVWGIEKIGGTWQKPVDWTEEFEKTWCRDLPNEDIGELVIVFGNINYKNQKAVQPSKPPTLEADPVGCRGWTGTTTSILTATSTDPAVTFRETVNTTMHFVVDSSYVTPGEPIEYFKVVSGQLSWHANVSGQCNGSAQGGFPITDLGEGEELATLRIWAEDGKRHHWGGDGTWPGTKPTYKATCPTGPWTLIPNIWEKAWASDPVQDSVATDGKSFGGDYVWSPRPDVRIRMLYRFRCVGC